MRSHEGHEAFAFLGAHARESLESRDSLESRVTTARNIGVSYFVDW